MVNGTTPEPISKQPIEIMKTIDEIIDSSFLNKNDFDKMKGLLKLENPEILNEFSPTEKDIIVLNFTQTSTPLIKGFEIIQNGNFVPFWLDRFEKEGVTKDEIKEGFQLLMK